MKVEDRSSTTADGMGNPPSETSWRSGPTRRGSLQSRVMADTGQTQAGAAGPTRAAVEAAARRVEVAAREIAAVVRRRERTALATLHRALFSNVGEFRIGIDQRLAPTIGGRAVSDRFTDVSVAASMIDISDAVDRGVMPGPAVPGLVELHVSVAGHHRTLEREMRLEPAEEQGWARAVFGPEWEDAAYYAGHSATYRSIPVAHFSLFLTAARIPTDPPRLWDGHLRRLTGPAATSIPPAVLAVPVEE